MRAWRKTPVWLALLLSLLLLAGCTAPAAVPSTQAPEPAATAAATALPETRAPAATATEPAVAPDGHYNSRDEVALYLHLYGRLPDNYITKNEARDLGWSGGSVERYAPGMAIGGDRFGNFEGNLPEARGRTYTECDIDTWGKSSRGAKRIVFSSDGLIFYTDDHYETFEQLY